MAFFLICLYFATGILAAGVPRRLATRAPQHSCQGPDGQSGFCPWEEVRKGISEDLLHQFKLMAQYTAAAYCLGNNDSPDTPITCLKASCPLVEEAGAVTVSEFQNTTAADNTGFLAVDETNRLIVLSFRGSKSKANWHYNYKIIRIRTELCPKCKIHHGFWKAWFEIRETVKPQVLRLMEAYPDFRFVITGHSLGGALAILAAGDLRKTNEDLGRRTELYSFGAPRVGNEATAEFLSKQSNQSYRITNRRDMIPRLPPWIFGYVNTSPEYYISKHYENPGPEDIWIFDGYLNHAGNSGTGDLFFGARKHHLYFTKDIAACSPKKDHSG